ncbi:MAG TPA: Y-family DNA polymerase [Gammaproteobacteria bacterium]|nr:Y-family DNA polymerase [Gammaproteobacteria bacterium]
MSSKIKPIFGLIDANNFYVSCEQVFKPSLKNKPVIVLSSNDGCVISRSTEAKALGIQMGEPIFKIRNMIKAHNVHYLSANFSLYADMSRRIMQVIAELVPSIEVYSIDEAFVDFTGIPFKNLRSLAHKIVKTLYQYTGIPTSLGISSTKTLAKVANRIVKKNVSFQNVFCLTKDIRHHWLKQTSVEAIWGVGKRWSKKLHDLNIMDAYQLSLKDPDYIKTLSNKVLASTVLELQGTPVFEIEQEIASKKQILVSRTFGKEVMELSELKEAVSTHLCLALEKLRRQESVSNSFSVFIQTDRFKEGFDNYHRQQSVELDLPSQNTQKFLKLAMSILGNLYTKGLHYKKAGVMLSDISAKSSGQYDLFAEDNEKEENLMCVLDKINTKLGKGKIRFAVEGYKKAWEAKSYHRSPLYTTSWNELLVVKT